MRSSFCQSASLLLEPLITLAQRRGINEGVGGQEKFPPPRLFLIHTAAAHRGVPRVRCLEFGVWIRLVLVVLDRLQICSVGTIVVRFLVFYLEWTGHLSGL